MIAISSILAIILLAVVGFKIKDTMRVNTIMSQHKISKTTIRAKSSTNTTTAVQQIMIGSITNNYSHALLTLKNIKASGYDAIELNDYMIHKPSLLVKMMTQFAGMPVGNGGNLNWHKLVKESGLSVISLHSDLGSLEKDPDAVIKTAKSFHTDTVVITGMYRFDYSSLKDVNQLSERLNKVGKKLAKNNIHLLYHNHNSELQKVTTNKTAYDVIIERTDPRYVNFEFDSYWMTDGGANVPAIMKKLGHRMKLWHITDRGHTKKGPYITPILSQDSTELGNGNMDLNTLSDIAKQNGVKGVILETHKNWVDGDPIKSIQKSATFMNKHFKDNQ
ncbi:sugar phosphate isomerase/epimerase family protein [Leuconostoc litchii]|uniref:sugar phosphate isomerase/epimerase family protein n=1 Tax=Leuconostoc litchii TaxID=1981069 RepID=UPI0024E06296|nr:TIM barrel protein [Leuconostoc litchii]